MGKECLWLAFWRQLTVLSFWGFDWYIRIIILLIIMYKQVIENNMFLYIC